MTYKEAIHFKAKQSSTFEDGGITYRVFVTPENDDDLFIYLRDIRGFYSHLTDDVAKKYSKNGQFLLRGLCYKNKDPNILYCSI
jgi:hypothetical protein